MAESSEPRRKYDSPRRREQAGATRHALLEAARELFTGRGYVATTIDSIAERARVSPETLYATFGSKRALLTELVDVSIAGGEGQPAILQQEWVREMREEPDPYRRVAILARNGRAILQRRAAVDEVVNGAAAADQEIAALAERSRKERYVGQRRLLKIVVGANGLRDGLDFETAADVLYAIASPETYRLLVVSRGWSGSRFERWYGDTLARLLLAPAAKGNRQEP